LAFRREYNQTQHYYECKTSVTPEWRPYSVPTALKKLQIAEVRAVQTPATLWKGCAIAYNAMQHVQNKRRVLAFSKAC